MALRGDYLRIYVDQYSSATSPALIADTTSVSVDFSAEAIETTSQDSALVASFIAGKVSGTISGDFLVATGVAQWARLFNHMSSGDVLEVEVYDSGNLYFSCSGVWTGLNMSSGDSTSLVTGSYSIQLSGTITFA